MYNLLSVAFAALFLFESSLDGSSSPFRSRGVADTDRYCCSNTLDSLPATPQTLHGVPFASLLSSVVLDLVPGVRPFGEYLITLMISP